MKKLVTLLAAGALTLSVVAAPPSNADDPIRPTFRTEDAWFHCTGTTKIYQVNWLSTLGNASTYAGWDSTPPTDSVAAGAGCGAADAAGTTNLFYNPVFHGYFEGNLRDITVRLHHLLLSTTRQGAPVELAVHLQIDGRPVFPPGPFEGGRVTVMPVPSETGATELFEFTITGLGFAEEVLDDDGNVIGVTSGGWAKEDGDGSREHEILLMVGVTDWPKPGAWVWDTTEVPSGMTFNAEEPADASLPAEIPE